MKIYVFSHSQLQAADCSNKYHIRYNLKLKSKRYSKIRALKMGTLFHAGIEFLYKMDRIVDIDKLIGEDVLEKAVAHVRALALQMRKTLVADEHEPNKLFERKLDIDMEIPVIMLKAYYRHVFLNERYEIVETEKKVKVNVRTPSGRKSPNMFYLGYMDAIVRNTLGDNSLYMHEVKTAATWTEKNDHFLAIDNQTTGYHWLAKELNIKIAGTIYTICLKPGSKPNLTPKAKAYALKYKKDNDGKKYTYDLIKDYETVKEYLDRIEQDYIDDPAKYFVRKFFNRTKEQLKRFEVELYYKCQDAKNIRNQPNFMQPNMMTCPGCDGYDLCQNWSEETIKRWYVRKGTDLENIQEIIIE